MLGMVFCVHVPLGKSKDASYHVAVSANVIIQTAVVGACHAADEWRGAVAVLDDMTESTVERDAMSKNWETSTCARASF